MTRLASYEKQRGVGEETEGGFSLLFPALITLGDWTCESCNFLGLRMALLLRGEGNV